MTQARPASAPYITYLAEYNALICKEHFKALPITQLDRHLRDRHAWKEKDGSRQPIVQYYLGIAGNALSHHDINYERMDDPASSPVAEILELASPEICHACKICGKIKKSLQDIQRHIAEAHDEQGVTGKRVVTTVLQWKEVEAQTFFRKTGELRWFEVRRQVNPPSPSPADLAPSLKRLMDEAWEESESRRMARSKPRPSMQMCIGR